MEMVGRVTSPAISPSGSYAIVTASETEPSIVELFDSEFVRVNRYVYPSFVTDLAINDKGDFLAVLLSGTDQASYATEVRFYEPGKTEIAASVPLGDGLGYSCAFTDKSNLALLSSNGVYYADVQGKLNREYSFEEKRIVAAAVNANGCGVLLEGSPSAHENECLLFGKTGEILFHETVAAGADAMEICERAAFLKYSDRILKIDASTGERREILCHTEGQTMLVTEEDRVLLCSAQKAIFYRFD